MQYNPVNWQWMYWNDFTLTGLTAWRDQTSQDLDDPDEEPSDNDTVAEDMAAAEDASVTTTED